MPDKDSAATAVHVPGPPNGEPMPVARFLGGSEVFLRLIVPASVKLVPGTQLLDGPASTRAFRVVREEGSCLGEIVPEGWRVVLVCARPDQAEQHEFRVNLPAPEATV